MTIRSFLLIGVLLLTSSARADWSATVFPIKSHSFGTVAVASKTEFRFPIHNTLTQPIHIQTVRASCGCTTPIVETEYIAPGQTGSVLARFNTPTFRGKKGATLTVVIDKPFYSEVQLKVDGYIRSDMVFHPGSVEFGSLDQGEPHQAASTIYYAGRNDWQVVSVRSNKPWLEPKVEQIDRGTNKATYKLTISVREDAPEGLFQDEIVVETNDRNMPSVPLRVSGSVETPLSISPQSIALGTVKSDQSITQRLVIKGREPFQLGSITAEGWDVDFEPTSTSKKIHVVTITLTPDQATGSQRVPLAIETAGDAAVVAKAILTAEVIAVKQGVAQSQ